MGWQKSTVFFLFILLSTIVVRRLSGFVNRQVGGRDVRERQVRQVFRRKQGTSDAPAYGERRVAPQDAALVLREVVIAALIKKLGGVGQHRIAMRKARRHIDHALILGG